MTCYCERCGAAIKNVFKWEDKNYGIECVRYVSGLNPLELKAVKDGNIEQYLVDKAQRVAQLEAAHNEYETKQEELKAIHATNNAWLIDFLTIQDTKEIYNSNKGEYVTIYDPGFYTSLGEQLTIKSLEELTDKQFDCIYDLLSKYNLKQLKSFTKELNIQLQPKLKKDDIIELILSKF